MPSIPENLGNLDSLKEREKKAFELLAIWQDILEDAYEYFLPQRNLFNREDKGQKKMDHIFDSTSLEAIKQGASKIQENIAPIWSRWATFTPSPEIIRLIEQSDGEVSEIDIRENLEEQAEIVFDVINRSNFGTQFFEFAVDLLIGTATMMIDEDESDEMPVIFNAIPQIGVAFEEGPHGTVETHWRRFKVKARNIERKWPGFEISAELDATIKNSPDTEIELSQGLVFDPKDKVYYAIVWVKSEHKVSWVEDMGESSPMITARYSKTAGEIRGRGPALDVLPDVKSLNKAKEFTLTKAAIDLSGMWTVTDDGITNPYTMQVAPGLMIVVSSNNSTNPTLARLDTGSNLELALFEIGELQSSIKRALFSELREPSDSVISATQFSIEARELAKRIGSAFGRLQTEALIPILKRVHHILKRRGLVEPITIGGREVTIKFTSPLAKAQDSEDLIAVQQAIEFTRITGGDDAVQISYKLEDIGKWAAEKTGMPQELVRNDSEKQEIIAASKEVAELGVQQEPPQPLRAVE